MILIDTAVWVDHLRQGNRILSGFLESGEVLAHPFVIGELALGEIRQRAAIINLLSKLPNACVASHDEVMRFIEQRQLSRRAIGYVDVHLLAAVELTPGARLWTYDKRLHRVAEGLGVALSAA